MKNLNEEIAKENFFNEIESLLKNPYDPKILNAIISSLDFIAKYYDGDDSVRIFIYRKKINKLLDNIAFW